MNRWVRLSAAVAAMVMNGNMQYAWTLFVTPMVKETGWKLSQVQWAFTLYIALGTFSMPVSGWMIDRIGPRAFMSLAGLLCGIGWAGMGSATTLTQLYVLYAIAGFGTAFGYSCAISVALKWFPDKRGLASGISAAGYGAGAAIFNPVFAYLIHLFDYRATFLYTGIASGAIMILAAQLLQNPSTAEVAALPTPPVKAKVRRHTEDFNSAEMLKTPQFYVLYGAMLMIGIGGLMTTAQVAPVAKSLGIGATALTVALSLNPLANGTSRIFWGWVSDHIGRAQTMFIAFTLQAAALTSVVTIGKMSGTYFIICMALVYFTWGELYTLFPAAQTDIFGARHAASNYSFLYTTKAIASILAGGLAATLFEKTGTWTVEFYGSAALAMCAALMAIAIHRMPFPKKDLKAAQAASPAAIGR
ncbi:MAG: oxalate/formate MFS antiporter [Acidobacteriota bacterium]|nr:oxalate/formate MFS antiporter [Acidobacteriota bacterium]